jgi:hypothetical protein
MSKIIEKVFKNIPLKARINAINEMGFINLIIELGFREDKMWEEKEDHILEKLMNLAHKHTEDILKEIKK